MPGALPKRLGRAMMFIHWKSLVVFGLIFWFLLCAFDLFGENKHQYISDASDYIFFKSEEKSNEKDDDNILPKLQSFSFHLMLLNSIFLMGSVLFCYVIRMLWFFCIYNRNNRNRSILSYIWYNYRRSNQNLSKIPIKVRSNSKGSDFRLSKTDDAKIQKLTNATTNTEFDDVETASSSGTRSLHKNVPNKDELTQENYVEASQLTALKQEMHKRQLSFKREQTELHKQINKLTHDKKELAKKLSAAQEQNKAAEQQIEELAKDKSLMKKKLDSLKKEAKVNIKSEKLALVKMEELSIQSDNLKQELEQVSRDKDILENKLKVLQQEYERLQERIILNPDLSAPLYKSSKPERETDAINVEDENGNIAEKGNVQQSLSKNDLNMKTIHLKIQQLEHNLENLTCNENSLNLNESMELQTESDLSLSIDDSKQDIDTKYESCGSETAGSDFPVVNAVNFTGSRRYYWMQQKININPYLVPHCSNGLLEVAAYKSDYYESEEDEYSSSRGSLDVDFRSTSKAVSKSKVFQKFMKHGSM